EYEEWIYGQPPQDVVFVRFIGDEVVQVKIAKVGGELIVKTQKEVEVKDGVPSLTTLQASTSPQDEKAEGQPQGPTHKPTLKRPDEQPDADSPQSNRKASTAPAPDEPQWGTNGSQQPANTSDQQQSNQQQPGQQPEPELTKRPPL